MTTVWIKNYDRARSHKSSDIRSDSKLQKKNEWKNDNDDAQLRMLPSRLYSDVCLHASTSSSWHEEYLPPHNQLPSQLAVE